MMDKADVFITGEKNRIAGVQNVLGAFDLSLFSGTSVAVKANFNSADPFPASTHCNPSAPPAHPRAHQFFFSLSRTKEPCQP